MTSASQDVVKENGVTDFDPFDAGAGALDVIGAVDPTLVFNETTANFLASATDPLHRIDLNLASIDATTMTGEVTTKRTARNVSNKNQTFDIKITQPAGVTITVGDKNKALKIDKGASLTIPITISAPAVADGQYFARINLIPRSGDKSVTIPVAFVRKQGAVSMTHTCAPTTFAANTGVSKCSVSMANLGSLAATVDLTVGNGDPDGKLVYKNASAPATVTGNQVKFTGSLVPALPPQVTSITPVGRLLVATCRCRCSASHRSRVSVTTRSRTSTCPRSSTAASPTRGSASCRTGTSWSAAGRPRTSCSRRRRSRPRTAEQRGRAVLERPQPGGRRCDPHRHAHRRREHVARRRLGGRPELQQHDGALVPGVAEDRCRSGVRGDHDRLRQPWRRSRRPASGVNWGAENRDGSSGKNIAANPATTRTSRSTSPRRRQAGRRR
jgi:hypothetical protein